MSKVEIKRVHEVEIATEVNQKPSLPKRVNVDLEHYR